MTRRGAFGMPAPEDPGRRGLYRPNRRLLYGLLVGVVVLALVRGFAHSGRAGGLATSCDVPSFAVADRRVPVGGPLALSVTGPSAGSYEVYVDAAAVAPDGTVTPYPGVAADHTELLSRLAMLPGCRAGAAARLHPDIAAGSHTLALFRIGTEHTRIVEQTIVITVD